MEKNILQNIGTTEKESYRVVKEADENNISNDILDFEGEATTSDNLSLEELIKNDDFIKVIKEIAIKCVDIKLKDSDILNTKKIAECKNELAQIRGQIKLTKEKHSNHPIIIEDEATAEILTINRLNDEIQKLRADLSSKDKIIEMLSKPNNNNEKNYNEKELNITNVVKHRRSVHSCNNGELSIHLENINDIQLENINENTNDLHCDNNKFATVTRKTANSKRTITIVGDSIIKDIQPYKMKHKLKPNDKLYVKTFNGATIEDMRDYVKPTLKRNFDLIVLHVGTNDLRNEKTADNIASDIMKLTLDMKTDLNDVMVSSLTSRADDLNAKGREVNSILKSECGRYDIYFIDNTNISIDKHLNGSGLHLNYKGTVTLANNFLNSIKI